MISKQGTRAYCTGGVQSSNWLSGWQERVTMRGGEGSALHREDAGCVSGQVSGRSRQPTFARVYPE